ncbi:MAG: type I-E CRISPR-associated protein Cas7/Cse4/CasC, partial [Candidatus Desantisbacteria bacterium]
MNSYQNLIVEFHILQSFPVTCLNRDDVGAPKTAMVGGTTRARVSSQCWKRYVRLAMRDFGANMGTRTKLIAKLIKDACLKNGATENQAQACGNKIEQIFIKKAKPADAAKVETADDVAGSDKTDNLLFLSPKELSILANAFRDNGFNPDAVIKQQNADKQ